MGRMLNERILGGTGFHRLWLKQRYSEASEYWRMDIESYTNSSPSVLLSEERLAQLKALFKTDLSDLAEEMNQRKMAGYQEALLRMMTEDLKKGL